MIFKLDGNRFIEQIKEISFFTKTDVESTPILPSHFKKTLLELSDKVAESSEKISDAVNKSESLVNNVTYFSGFSG